MKRFIQPGFLFTISGIFIIIFHLFSSHDTVDIAIHDTYFVIDKIHFSFIMGIPFLFIAFFYFLFKKLDTPLYKLPGFIHYILTILFLAIIYYPMPGLHRYYSNSTEIHALNERINSFIAMAAILLVFSQFIFLANIMATLFKKKNTGN